MTPEQRAAYIYAMAASMLVEMESMKALNRERVSVGFGEAYDEKAFLDLIDKYGLHHNQVVETFTDI